MKHLFVLFFTGAAALAALVFAACGSSALPFGYTLEFPEIPAHWRGTLGEPRWRVEWIRPDGTAGRAVFDAGTAGILEIPAEWPCPVLAWPFWPGVEAGLFQPAGALYPFDAAGGRIRLSWRGGADAAFYRALEEAAAASAGAKAVRHPRYFDWSRFRAFMAQDAPAILREDPWLADWKSAAAKTISSSFRASYVKAGERAQVELEIPCDGPWISSSPFRSAGYWNAGETVELALGAEPEVWICSGGILILSKTAKTWAPKTDAPP
jgi:hypothetical protein